MRKLKEVFSAKTGTGASIEVLRKRLCPIGSHPIKAKLTLSYGATPTITIHIEGQELDDSWISLVNATYTTGATKYLKAPHQTRHRKYRLNITANTNVTVTKGYIGVGMVED